MINTTIKSLIGNLFSNKEVQYIVEDADWSIKADGINIVTNLHKLHGRITTSDHLIKRKSIIHYGSFNLFINKSKFPTHRKQIIATCFHLIDGDERNNKIKNVDQFISKWHTSCEITKNKLIHFGVEKDKITVIPLGVDLKVYHPVDANINSERFLEAKKELRHRLGIPKDAFVIGSFQKDGEGWDEGNKPKLIKGPDVFCDAISKINSKKRVFVLLSGPARGYVKNRLKDDGIEYKHFIFDNPGEVAELYRAIDLYIIASREEGGPKAILESMASGVPVISTKVGMAPDIIKDNENGLLCEIEDSNRIAELTIEMMKDTTRVDRLIKHGLQTANQFEMGRVVEMYEKLLYSDF